MQVMSASSGLLDRLQTIAPVRAVRGTVDEQEEGSRVVDPPRLIEAGGLAIRVTFDMKETMEDVALEEDVALPRAGISAASRRAFGQPVDLVVFAATHRPLVTRRSGVTFVNPGSPVSPAVREAGESGTVAILDIHDGTFSVEIVHLALPNGSAI